MRSSRPAVAAAALVAAIGAVAAAATPAAMAQAPRGKPFFDSRSADRRAVQRSGAQSLVAPRPATRVARARSGDELDVDPITGTPRALGGEASAPLSEPSPGDPADIAMRYVREHLALLGLTAADLGTLQLQPRPPGPEGTTDVRFSQVTDGIPAFDNSLRVIVAADGSVLQVLGSPQHELSLDSAVPLLTAPEAMARLRENVGASGTPRVLSGPEGVTREHEFSTGDTAELVAFGEGDATRLGWRVSSRGPGNAWYAAVVDAESGKLLYRANLTRYDDSASVWEQYPGATRGGGAATQPLTRYLTRGANHLEGPYARLWSDLDDDNRVDSGEEITRNGAGNFRYAFNPFTAAENPNGGCSPAHMCSWDFETPDSWRTNRAQNGVQAFYYVNKFRDHLVSPPISFSAADGNFEGGDRVLVNTDDGAGRLDDDHVDNAFMVTPPNGQSPLMAMFLFGSTTAFREINGGDDAAIVYHEYTHGLSSRLVTNGSGDEALNDEQAGAMGEGWSDWYAKDFLVSQFPADDTAAPGEVDMGKYTDNFPHVLRSQALDCPVGASASACPGTSAMGSGGYTYGDFNKVSLDGTEREVHEAGEIWAETLWDVRDALGSATAERIITEGMRNHTPAEPTMLDARDGIIAADHAIFGQNSHAAALWQVFAHRGMGTNAATTVVPNAPDVVTEGFKRPPVISATATPAQADAGQDISFHANASDPDGGSVDSYEWDFGDGTTQTTTEPANTHAFAANGNHDVRVTATDSDGDSEYDVVTVHVGPVATPTPSPSPTASPSASPTPAATVTPPPPPPPPPPSAKPAVSISRTGTKARIRFVVTCDSACAGTAKLTISRKLARRLGLEKRTLVTRRVSLSQAGTKRYTLKLSRKVTRAMKRVGLRRISTKLRVSVRDAESQAGARTRAPRIRR